MFRRFVPGFENAVLDSISPSIGIRESRRFAGLDRLTGDAVLAGLVPSDTVALGGYKVDIHNGEGKGTILKQVKQPYGIPLGCLISADVDGLLLSGRCISMDSPALGSMRIMPTCMAIGEAAGVCAAHAIRDGVSLREVPANVVTADLLAVGAILE
jgi:hypothetical protein